MSARCLKPILLLLGMVLCAWQAPAMAARTHAISPISVEFDMGTTQTLSFTITNTSGGGNICERIYEMRFRLPGTGTVFSSATAAPANWTRTAFSTTSVTFRANSWANSIDTPPGGSKSCVTGQGTVTATTFNLVMVMRTTTADVTETLRDSRASFTLDTNFVGGIARAGRHTVNSPGSWTLRGLQIVSMQTVDVTTGLPIGAINAGASFRLVVTVRNISSVAQSSIVSSPNPPTTNKTGTWPGGQPSLTSTVYSPNPLTLAAGATGTITFTYSTSTAVSGTISFSAYVRNSTSSTRSATATSNTLLVSPLSVSLLVKGQYPADATCHFDADIATIEMTVINNTSSALTSITPSTPARFGTNTTIGAYTGPTTTCVYPLAIGNSCKFTWTAPVTVVGTYPVSGPKPDFYVTASATANPGPVTSPTATSNTQDVDGYIISVTPTDTNASSINAELTWTLTNRACDNLDQLAITPPAGFVYGGDGYALVTDTTAALNDSWSVTGTTFRAPLNNVPAADPGRMPVGRSGDFSLLFSSTPVATGNYTFTLLLTDDNGVGRTRNVVVPVNPFGTGSINLISPATPTWREQFQ